MIAWINGSLGVLATAGIGHALGLSWYECAAAVVVSNGVGLYTVLLTLKCEKVPWIRQKVLNRSLKTWTFFTLLYFVSLWVFLPFLRTGGRMAWMALPLIFSNALMFSTFGRIQDYLVRRAQTKLIR